MYEKFFPNYSPEAIRKMMSFLPKYGVEKNENGKYGRMIDVGGGNGRSTVLFSPYFEFILGFDISEEQIKSAKELYRQDIITSFKVGDESYFPVEDATIDFVSCAGTAHSPDIEMFERECQRVLKPN